MAPISLRSRSLCLFSLPLAGSAPPSQAVGAKMDPCRFARSLPLSFYSSAEAHTAARGRKKTRAVSLERRRQMCQGAAGCSTSAGSVVQVSIQDDATAHSAVGMADRSTGSGRRTGASADAPLRPATHRPPHGLINGILLHCSPGHPAVKLHGRS